MFGTGAGCSLHGIEGIIGIEGLVAIALLLLHCSSSNTFISSSRFLLARTLFLITLSTVVGYGVRCSGAWDKKRIAESMEVGYV